MAATTRGRNVNTRNPAIKRIMKEFAQFQNEVNTDFVAYPLEDNLFEWHFTISGPPGSEFDGGKYHGKILLPSDYPFKPPDIVILTPSGRFQTHTKICLSITGYHPKSWQPSWGIRTTLTALRAFFPTHAKGAIGGVDSSKRERRRLASISGPWRCDVCEKTNDEMLGDDNSDTGSAGAPDSPAAVPVTEDSGSATAAVSAEANSEADSLRRRAVDTTDIGDVETAPETKESAASDTATDTEPPVLDGTQPVTTRDRTLSVSVPQASKTDRALSLLTVVLMALILFILVRKAWIHVSNSPFQFEAAAADAHGTFDDA